MLRDIDKIPYFSYLATFPLPFTVVHTKVVTPLTNFIIYPLCFLTAYKMMSHSSVLDGASDSKKPDLYYSHS